MEAVLFVEVDRPRSFDQDRKMLRKRSSATGREEFEVALHAIRQVYRQRNVVERCVGWLKENRRVAVRYEKLAINYLGMIKLAMIQRYVTTQFPNRA